MFEIRIFKHEFVVFLLSFPLFSITIFILKKRNFEKKIVWIFYMKSNILKVLFLSFCFFSVIFLQFVSNETNLKKIPLCSIILSICWDLSKLKVKNSAVPSTPGQAKQNTVLQRRAFMKNIPIDL